jgi:anti-sigma B factor antagonist
VGSLDNFPVEWAHPLAIVKLPDEIDISIAEQVRDTLLAVLNQGITTLVIDMTQTSFCGVAGASAVARAHRRARASGAEIRLVAGAPIVRRVLAMAGVDRLVPVYASLSAALAATGAPPSGQAAGEQHPLGAQPQ